MEQQTKNCPYCGEEILAVAKKCKHCGEWLETKEEKETTPAVSAEATPKPEATPVSHPATEKPASEVAPSETYYESSTKKIVVGAITAVLVILTIWLFVSPPKIEFDYIFDTIPYGIIFMALSVFAVFYFATLFDEKRTSRIYLNSNGDLDIETPREYKPLSVSFASKILMRANIYGQKNLDLFRYQDGRVLVRNSKGNEIEGALKDLTFAYKMDKNKATDEWYIYQFIITDTNDNKVQFNRHDSLFTDEEYADIEMLLSLAGTMKESKVSKFTRKADSILSEIGDLDFSKLTSSAVELVGSTATSKITNAVGLFAKKRIFDRLSDKKKSLFTRIKEYGIWTVIAIIALVLIWVNITNAMEAYGGESDSEEMEYYYEQDNSDSYEKEVPDVIFPERFNEYTYDGIFKCKFSSDSRYFYLSFAPESGQGVYRAPSGNFYILSVTQENDNRTEFICSTEKEDGSPSTIEFLIKFSDSYDRVEGVMLGTDGITQFEYSGFLMQ